MDNCTYADAFAIMGSLTDLKIDFALTQPTPGPDGKIIGTTPQTEHRIILSVPLAKDLAKKLMAAVSDYEKNFGTVVDMNSVVSVTETQE